jgi:hypothetical protein
MPADVKSRQQLFLGGHDGFSSVHRQSRSQEERRVLPRLSAGWLPPSVPPSGACLALGPRGSCRLCTPSRAPPPRRGGSADGRGHPAQLGGPWQAGHRPEEGTGTCWALAPMHPPSARAMATTTCWACGPRAMRRRYRFQSRPWACPLLSWRGLGSFSQRRWRGRRPLAGSRSAHAPAPSARRAWVGPALVLAPWRRRSPVDDAEGISPTQFRSALG